MGRNWAKNLRDCPEVKTVGWMDIRPGAPQAAIEELRLSDVPGFDDLQKAIAESRPDFVVDVTAPEAHYSVTLAALAAGIPRRIAVHHNPLPTYPKAARVMDQILGHSGAYSEVVAVSEAVAVTFRADRYKCPVTTIHNGLSLPNYHPSLDPRARWGIPDGKPVLLTVGRLSRQKNHAVLLQALRDIPEAHLAIVGGGELRDDLTALASALRVDDRVHFTGEIAPEDVVSLLKACDVFVFPSLWEGLPMAAIEALQAGAPVVASDIPANREVLGDAAILVPASDASALAAAVRMVLEDPTVANRLRTRAKERAARFTARSMIDRYCELICGEPPASTISLLTDRVPAPVGFSKEYLP